MKCLVTFFVAVVCTTNTLNAEEPLPLRPEGCIMPPPEGDCGGTQQDRWFFDVETGSCLKFLYQGCPGVGSTFETQEECRRVCGDVSAEDDLQPKPEIQISVETLSTVPVNRPENNQNNAKLTTSRLPEVIEEVKGAAVGGVEIHSVSQTPLPPSGTREKLPGRADRVESTQVATALDDKTTISLSSENVQKDDEISSVQSKNVEEIPGRDQEDGNSTTGQSEDLHEGPGPDQESEEITSVDRMDTAEDPGTAVLSPESPSEPNDQPGPSKPALDATDSSRGLSTPFKVMEGQPDPPFAEPVPDADHPGQKERQYDDDDDDERDEEVPAGFQDPDRPTILQREVVQIGPKEAPEEEVEDREEKSDINPTSEIQSGSRATPDKIGSTRLPVTSKLSTVKELQRAFPTTLTFVARDKSGKDEAQLESTDKQGHPESLSTMSVIKGTDQETRHSDESRKANNQPLKERFPPEVTKISTSESESQKSRAAVLQVPGTRGPVRVTSPLDNGAPSDDLSRDSKQEGHADVLDGSRNIDAPNQVPEAFPLLGDSPHTATVEKSRNVSQLPSANGQSMSTPSSSKEGMPPIKRSDNPLTVIANVRTTSGNLAARTKLDVPHSPLFAKSERDYRRPTFCSLHKVRGRCTEHVNRWYFNPFNGSCQLFTYSGCGGNPNNFETMDACLVTCTGKGFDSSQTTQNDFQEDNTPDRRIQMRSASPDWLARSDSLVESSPRQPTGVEFFIDMLRRKLPPPPPPPPPFLRSLAFPFLSSGGPGGNVADQKMSLVEMGIEDSGKPEDEQRRSRPFTVPSEKRFHLPGTVSGKQLDQPKFQRSRSPEFRSPSNQPEKATIDSDIETLRKLLQPSARESPASVFDPIPLGRYPGTSSPQKSRPNGHRHVDSRKSDRETRRTLMDKEEGPSVSQFSRNHQNRQSPGVGLQRFGRFVNDGRHLPPPPKLKNFRWIEQAVVVSDLPPGRLDIPFWFGEEMMMKKARPVGRTPNWRDSAGPRSDPGNPQNALTLRRNSMIFETRQRGRKLQDLEMEKLLESRVTHIGNALVPQALRSDRMSMSSGRGLPHQFSKQPQSPFSTSYHSFPARENGNTDFHDPRSNRPQVEQTAGRAVVGRMEDDFMRPNQAEVRRSGSREDLRGVERRPEVVGREKNRQEQDRERPPSQQRRRTPNNGLSVNRPSPDDRFTFLQIFVNREQPHFLPKPSAQENQYLSQRLPPSRSEVDPHRFQTSQNGAYNPPPLRQLSPMQRSIQISRDTMTDEREWSPASRFSGPRTSGEFENARIEGSDLNEDSRDMRMRTLIPFVCQLPLEPGSCAEYQAKWFYHHRKGSCELFYYGGCSGNGNRFDSRDECLQTCEGGRNANSDDTESRSLDDTFGPQPSDSSSEEVIILTSPVYGEMEEDVKNTATVKVMYPGYDHVGRSLISTDAPFLYGNGKGAETEESNIPLDIQVDAKTTDRTTAIDAAGKSEITESAGNGEDGATQKEEEKEENDLSKTFSTQYIAIVTALGVVGIAVVLMIILSIVRLCRRVRKSKREHCIQEVIKSHMYGDLPHVLYSESPSSVDSSEKEKSEK